MKSARIKKALFLIFLAALFLFSGWVTIRWLGPRTVVVIHPTRGPAVQAVYATGTVEASVMMPIAARTSARLMKLNVDEGSQVTKNQVLAELEDEDLRYSLKELKAREALAKMQFERNQSLVKRDLISKELYDRSRTEWEAATAAVRAAETQIRYMKLLAPADGRIIRRDGEVGELIPANQPVFWLSCCAPLRISAEVDEEDISLVQPNQEVLIRADAFPEQIYRGKVQSITPKGDPVARSYRVRISFAEDTPLMIGMTAETNILVREAQNALLLPVSAVEQGQVWLVKNHQLIQHKITIGAKGAEQIEVLDGITENDLIVVKPMTDFEPGQAVRPRLLTASE